MKRTECPRQKLQPDPGQIARCRYHATRGGLATHCRNLPAFQPYRSSWRPVENAAAGVENLNGPIRGIVHASDGFLGSSD